MRVNDADIRARVSLQQRVMDAVATGKGWETIPPDIRKQSDTIWFKSWILFDPQIPLKRIKQPVLIVGHSRDPVHPFSDSGMLAEELENATLVEANSILEWRLTPRRLDEELAEFLDQVWGPRRERESVPAEVRPARSP